MVQATDDRIKIALAEDIGAGDITTENLVLPEDRGKGIIVAKEPLVIAGLQVAGRVFELLEPSPAVSLPFRDGDAVKTGDVVMEISATMRTLLMGERTALNFLQHLSGIATFVRAHVEEMGKTRARLVDTRKTTPGLRVLEKYAVRVGGAGNHRMGLYDGVLIKDNHIAAAGGIRTAVETIRSRIHHLVKIEVEVSNMAEVEEALAAGADVIMLDNMNLDRIREAVKLIDKKALVEVSGGIKKEDLSKLADAGVDIISAGALTHSARSVDLSMRIQSGTHSP
ncbi:MAG: carboxylating nicotinate-nucleotide diphosphorylase [Desulfobacterales bacterium]